VCVVFIHVTEFSNNNYIFAILLHCSWFVCCLILTVVYEKWRRHRLAVVNSVYLVFVKCGPKKHTILELLLLT